MRKQEKRTFGQPACSLNNAHHLNKGKEDLEDLWEDHAKKDRRLLTRIRDYQAHRYAHKQAWNCYTPLAEECDELEQKAWQELERGRLGEQGLESKLSLNLQHHWGKEEL